MKKQLFKITAILYLIIVFIANLTLNVNNSSKGVNLINFTNVAFADPEGGASNTSDCGKGYDYYCGYFPSTGLDAYEGPYYA